MYVLLVSVPPPAGAGEQLAAAKRPLIFDVMSFRGKPNLGLSRELSFIYEWEATLRDEGAELTSKGSNAKPSSRTIEPHFFSRSIKSRADFEYIVIDIESLAPSEDPIAVQYVKLAKAAVPNSKVAWWNLGPGNVRKTTFANESNQQKWRAAFDERKLLVEANDFCILGAYFKSTDRNIQTWKARHIPRIAEARRLYGSKQLLVTLAPHYFDRGKPWPFIGGKMLGEAIDLLAEEQVDGIVLWSHEGTGKTQLWNENHGWVHAVRMRTDSGGRYRRPALTQ